MRLEEVAHQLADRLQLVSKRRILRQTRRHKVILLPPGLDIAINELGRLVERDPVAHLLAKSLDHLGHILRVDSWEVLPDQSSSFLHMNRPGEVMQRHYRLHACCSYRLDQLPVVSKSFVTELSRRRFKPRPCKRKTKRIASKIFRQLNILTIAIPKVRGLLTLGQVAFPLPNISNILKT